ncbi:unnamed protein product [Amoebophrya sp. A120]|nr:unnamed protein product [Amoebophrya sp. A120]|eukprot:GSA120T00006774001.1
MGQAASTCCSGGEKQAGESLEISQKPIPYDSAEGEFKPNLSEAKYTEKVYPVGKYQGQMLKGKRCGEGVCNYNAGPSYEGQWWEDRCHGQGKFSDKDSVYTGQWKQGKKHGFGEELWKDDGTKYVGNHVMGNKHGKGKYIWQDGSSYEGQFENDVVQGEGVLKDTDGGVYSGQFFDNMQHGRGKYVLQNVTYEGQWVETLKHGTGKETTTGVSVYEGQFNDGLRHGAGKETDLKTGQTKQVRYENGEKA